MTAIVRVVGAAFLLGGLAPSAHADEGVSVVRVTAAPGVSLSEREGALVRGFVQQELVFAELGDGERVLWGQSAAPGASLQVSVEVVAWTCGTTCKVELGFRLYDNAGTVLFYGMSEGTSGSGPKRERLSASVRSATVRLAENAAFRHVVQSVRQGDAVAQEPDEDPADLAERVAALERGTPPATTANDEQEAANLLKTATQLADEGDADGARAVLAELASRFGSTRAAKAAVRVSDELAIVGKKAIPLTVDKWIQGGAPGPKSKATVLVFFEAWCPHCRREMPRMQQTQAQFADRGLSIVGITRLTRDVTEESLRTMLDAGDPVVAFPVGKEDGSLTQHYGVRGIPAAAVVVDGVVVWRGHPAKLDDAKIEGFLTR